MIASVDCTIVHTSVEAAIIRQDLPVENIVEFPYIAEKYSSEVSFSSRQDIIFVGGFRHDPNIDAMVWFVEEIWPELMPNLPREARFVIVGDSPPAAVECLAGGRVVVTGYVPDLRPYFDCARVAVAPLRYGAGIKGKVVQSFCFGVPSVVTPIAAEGIGLTSGQEALIAQSAVEIANCVAELYLRRAPLDFDTAEGIHICGESLFAGSLSAALRAGARCSGQCMVAEARS